MVEQRTENPRVAGSIPALATMLVVQRKQNDRVYLALNDKVAVLQKQHVHSAKFVATKHVVSQVAT